jgi:hypothetical protein
MTDSQALLTRLYHVFRAPRRRYVIQVLKDREKSPVTTRELAKIIAGIEEGTSKQEVTGEPYRNVYNALSQTHLPTLSEADVIVYDSTRQTVSADRYLKLAALLLNNNAPTVEVFSTICDTESESGEQ